MDRARQPSRALLIYNPRSELHRSIARACRSRAPPRATRIENDDASNPRARRDAITRTTTGRTHGTNGTKGTIARSIDDHRVKKQAVCGTLNHPPPGTAHPARARRGEATSRVRARSLYIRTVVRDKDARALSAVAPFAIMM